MPKNRNSTSLDVLDQPSTLIEADIPAVLAEIAAMTPEERADVVWSHHEPRRAKAS